MYDREAIRDYVTGKIIDESPTRDQKALFTINHTLFYTYFRARWILWVHVSWS